MIEDCRIWFDSIWYMKELDCLSYDFENVFLLF